jgi:hypothetical protein
MLYIILANVFDGVYCPVATSGTKEGAGHYAAYYLDSDPAVESVVIQWYEEFDAGDVTEISIRGSVKLTTKDGAEEFRRSAE